MSDIDDIIRRSREPGQFSERKEFTIAKDRAIEKMRKFALKTPSHYILELIQGAVANGATYIDASIDSNITRVAWTGGIFSQKELQQIFDYLFSDNTDEESTAIRQLAVGVNALLAFKPSQIVIESGDGTFEHSTRIEIDPKTMHITAGKTVEPLNGTFLLASNKQGISSEVQLIGERCLTLNIPIIVNDEVLFGYSSIRSPNLFGVSKTIKFDEGDFYGTIGLSKGANTDNFKILTHGVWIQTVKRNLGIPHKFGGVIAFDHLNKTVDHATIVEDEKWNEMWARVSLLARQLISDKNPNEISMKYKGSWAALDICRKIAAQAEGAILFRGESVNDDLIAEYERIFGLPGFFVPALHFQFVCDILGTRNIFVAKGTQEELDYLRRPKVGKPKGPFFLDPLVFGEFEVRFYNRTGKVHIYTPRSLPQSQIEFVEGGRLAELIDIPNHAPGFKIRFDLDVATNGWVATEQTAYDILDACSATMRNLSVQIADDYASVTKPDTTLAFHVLRALASSTIFSVDGGVFSIRRLGTETDAILKAPILKTLDDEPKSIIEIVDLMNTQFGLVYGCIQGIHSDLTHLDKTRILSLTPQQEKEIISLFGDTAYIRIDDRDILASHTDANNNTFLIRDMAVGLGAYDAKFICCENNEDISIDSAVALVHQLRQCVFDADDNAELRRQSLRHLIWILTHPNTPTNLAEALKSSPLFRNHKGEVISFNDLENEVEMLDGWPVGPIKALTKISESSKEEFEILDGVQVEATKTLALNPFVFHMLSRKKNISAQSDSSGTRADLRSSVLSTWVDNDTERGTICLMPRHVDKSFSVINTVTRHVNVASAGRFMCSGELFTESDDPLLDRFLHHSIKLFEKAARLINQSSDLSKIHGLAEPALFGVLPLIDRRLIGNAYRLSSRFPEVNILLNCKIFVMRGGVPISAHTLTQTFEKPTEELSENAPAYQREWVDKISMMTPNKLVQPDEKKVLWKKHLFSNSTSMTTHDWICSFVRDLTTYDALFSDTVATHFPIIQVKQKQSSTLQFVVILDQRRLSQYEDNRIWLAMKILFELRRLYGINSRKHLDYQQQIAQLIVEHNRQVGGAS